MNETLDFKDISDEQYREYVFAGGETVRVTGLSLHVSASGGHRIIGADGLAHYIPAGWVHLRWLPKPGSAFFQF